MTNQSTQDAIAARIVELWEHKGRAQVTPLIEDICNRWQGNTPMVSNLIRAANDRYFSVTIDPETGHVCITEPENDLEGNVSMLTLLISHFDAIQADAYDHLAGYLHDIDADEAEAA